MDPEFDAMTKVLEALLGLDKDAALRVLEYCQKRVYSDPAILDRRRLPDGSTEPIWYGELRSFINADRKILAIKLYREKTGASLRDARDAVFKIAAQMGKL